MENFNYEFFDVPFKCTISFIKEHVNEVFFYDYKTENKSPQEEFFNNKTCFYFEHNNIDYAITQCCIMGRVSNLDSNNANIFFDLSDGKTFIKITFWNNQNITNFSNICRSICVEKIINGAQLIVLGKLISYDKDVQLSLVNFQVVESAKQIDDFEKSILEMHNYLNFNNNQYYFTQLKLKLKPSRSKEISKEQKKSLNFGKLLKYLLTNKLYVFDLDALKSTKDLNHILYQLENENIESTIMIATLDCLKNKVIKNTGNQYAIDNKEIDLIKSFILRVIQRKSTCDTILQNYKSQDKIFPIKSLLSFELLKYLLETMVESSLIMRENDMYSCAQQIKFNKL